MIKKKKKVNDRSRQASQVVLSVKRFNYKCNIKGIGEMGTNYANKNGDFDFNVLKNKIYDKGIVVTKKNCKRRVDECNKIIRSYIEEETNSKSVRLYTEILNDRKKSRYYTLNSTFNIIKDRHLYTGKIIVPLPKDDFRKDANIIKPRLRKEIFRSFIVHDNNTEYRW